MTTILLIAFLVLAVYCRVWLFHVAKHDRVLFPICQLRRDVLKFLYEDVFKEKRGLSSSEYDSVLRLSDALDAAIHNYNEHKTLLFDARKMAKLLKDHEHLLDKARPVDVTENPAIQNFHARFVLCLAKAFLAYTPLIRSELALRLVVLAYRDVSKKLRQDVLEGARQVRGVVQGAGDPAAMRSAAV